MSELGSGERLAAAPAPKLRLHGVDALRGIAASLIVVHHVVGINLTKLPPYLAFIPTYFGYGVPLFFIISAFSLYYTYVDRMENRLDIRDYMVRRFARIAPLFYFMIAVWYATYHFHFGQWLTWSSIASNVTFTFNFVTASRVSIVWAGWSIGTEYAFYFFLPLIIALVRNQLASLLLLIAAFAAAIGYQFSQSHVDDGAFILTHMPFFTMGIIAYFVFRRLSHWAPKARRVLSVALVATAVVAIAGITVDGPFRRLLAAGIRRTDYYAWGLPFAFVVLSQAIYPLSVLTNKVTTFLGKISYSLYLVHPWVILMCRPMYVYLENSHQHILVYLLLATIPTFAIVVPLAWVTYRLIEVPGMNWGKRASMHKEKPRRIPEPAVAAAAGVQP